MSTILRIFTTCIAMLIMACGPSAKSETQAWENNLQAVSELGTQWPGFKSLLETRKKEAEPAWEEALKLGDDEAKAAKMKEVNARFDPLLSKLNEVKSKVEALRNTINKLAGLKLSGSNAKDRSAAMDDAHGELAQVEEEMRAATPTNDAEAVAIADAQIAVLISRQGTLDRTYDRLKPKKAANTKKSSKKK